MGNTESLYKDIVKVTVSCPIEFGKTKQDISSEKKSLNEDIKKTLVYLFLSN
jgi:hypothetical protein